MFLPRIERLELISFITAVLLETRAKFSKCCCFACTTSTDCSVCLKRTRVLTSVSSPFTFTPPAVGCEDAVSPSSGTSLRPGFPAAAMAAAGSLCSICSFFVFPCSKLPDVWGELGAAPVHGPFVVLLAGPVPCAPLSALGSWVSPRSWLLPPR